MRLRVATRRSPLALAQTRAVVAQLTAVLPSLQVEEKHVVTTGDKMLDGPLYDLGGKGLFVSEVEALLLQGEADFAVHSLKDVPADLASGLILASTPLRADPRDVLVTTQGLALDELSAGQTVGTSSLRRVGQLRERRPDLRFALLRGNVDTRVRKLMAGEYDAIVIAHAGLLRLNMTEVPRSPIPEDIALPAVGQGTLAIESRAQDPEVIALLRQIQDDATRVAVEAERQLLFELNGGCRVPLAGYARLEEGGRRLRLDGWVGSIDGERAVSAGAEVYLPELSLDAQIDAARALGTEVADTLRDAGAGALLAHAASLSDMVGRHQS